MIEKNLQPRVLYPARISFEYEGEIKSFTDKHNLREFSTSKSAFLKKGFIGPGLYLRPVRADHTQPPLQWTLKSLLSACGNNNGRIRPPPDRGTLKIISRLLIT